MEKGSVTKPKPNSTSISAYKNKEFLIRLESVELMHLMTYISWLFHSKYNGDPTEMDHSMCRAEKSSRNYRIYFLSVAQIATVR